MTSGISRHCIGRVASGPAWILSTAMSAIPASIVLIEDNVPQARLVALLLDGGIPGGADVRQVATAAAAVGELREHDADVVLLVLGAAGSTGLEGLAALQAGGVEAPILVLGAAADDELALDAIRAGAQDYVVVGDAVSAAALVRAVHRAVERHRAQLRTEDLLRAKEDRWRTLTHLAPVGIVELEPDRRCMFANERVAALLGRPPEAVLGHGWLDALHADDRGILDDAWSAAADGAGSVDIEVRFVHPDGDVVWGQVTAVVVRDPWGAPAGWLGTLVDVTAARRARDDLRDLARTDPLTHLRNRRAWDERLVVELARARRSGRPLSVALLDLDRFKAYNDRHGHQAGDRLLAASAGAWQAQLRASDLLCRLGGDEFALLLPDCHADCAHAIVARLQAATDAEVGCSAGLARWDGAEDADTLLARADAALYAQKAAGRGGVSVA